MKFRSILYLISISYIYMFMSASAFASLSVQVKLPVGNVTQLQLKDDATVGDLKSLISQKLQLERCNVRLMTDEILDNDDTTIKSLELTKPVSVFYVGRPGGGCQMYHKQPEL